MYERVAIEICSSATCTTKAHTQKNLDVREGLTTAAFTAMIHKTKGGSPAIHDLTEGVGPGSKATGSRVQVGPGLKYAQGPSRARPERGAY